MGPEIEGKAMGIMRSIDRFNALEVAGIFRK